MFSSCASLSWKALGHMLYEEVSVLLSMPQHSPQQRKHTQTEQAAQRSFKSRLSPLSICNSSESLLKRWVWKYGGTGFTILLNNKVWSCYKLLYNWEETSLTGHRGLSMEQAVCDWLVSSPQIFTNVSSSPFPPWAECLRSILCTTVSTKGSVCWWGTVVFKVAMQ